MVYHVFLNDVVDPTLLVPDDSDKHFVYFLYDVLRGAAAHEAPYNCAVCAP
jgi:hypothetical protein